MTAEGRHLRKRSFSLAGHRTSVALEAEFWAALEAVAAHRGLALATLVAELDAGRALSGVPLASALRVFALGHAQAHGVAEPMRPANPDPSKPAS